jgi:hypothetical protein
MRPILISKVKPNINSVEVHPQLSTNGHPVDGALVGAGSLWPTKLRYFVFFTFMDISIRKNIICVFGLNVLLRGN